MILLGLEMDQAGEQQNHVAALVHDGTMAVRAADFAGELVFDALGCWIIPLEVVVAVQEVDVVFVEDRCPLERSSCAIGQSLVVYNDRGYFQNIPCCV